MIIELVQTCGPTLRSNIVNLRGQRFGRLTVLEYAGSRPVTWHVRCDCGKEKTVRSSDLRSGKTVSCGCYGRERSYEARYTLNPTYVTVHDRLRKYRGRASQHLCQRCGQPALDWAYRGGDPDEMTSTFPRTFGMAYSTNLEFYVPLCRVCHVAVDQLGEPWSA